MQSRSENVNPQLELEAKLAKRFNWWWRGVFVEVKAKVKDLGSLAGCLAPSGGAERSSGAEAAAGAERSGVLFGLLHLRRERSAYLYELGKRVSGKYEFAKPWILLTEAQWRRLEQRWPDPEEHLVCEEGGVGTPTRAGWTRRITVSANLRLHNRTILTALMELIAGERRRLRMPNPRPNQGRKRRSRSWRAIELLDLQHDGVRVLNNGESSQISKVRKLARREGIPPRS